MKKVYDVKIVNASMEAKPKDFYENTIRGIIADNPKQAVRQALRHFTNCGRWSHLKIEVLKIGKAGE